MTTAKTKETPTDVAATEHTRDLPVYLPATDIYETENTVEVLADMPGVDEQHVDVSLENNVLTLTGHREAEQEEGRTMVCCGYAPGNFKRTFTLSDDVDREGIKARIKDGVLRVTLPKAKELQARKIKVEAGT